MGKIFSSLLGIPELEQSITCNKLIFKNRIPLEAASELSFYLISCTLAPRVLKVV
jgi:hypothetical protein